MDESVIEKILKKYLSNTINSTINKKVFKNEAKIDELIEKTNNILLLFNNINDKIDKILSNKNNNLLPEQSNNLIKEIHQETLLKKVDSKNNIEFLKKINENITKSYDSDSENEYLNTNNKKINLYEDMDDKEEKIDEQEKIDEKKKISKIRKQKNINENKEKNINENKDKNIKKYIDVKVQHFNIDESFIRKCLDMTSTNGDIQLFKKMYIENIEKEYIPIRHIKKKFQYWINDHMQDDDTNGEYISNVILKNIELCYMKVNNMDNYGDDIEQFLKNQEHINRILDVKYKEKIMVQIIQLIDI